MGTNTHVPAAHASVVQALPSLQAIEVPTHRPALQASPVVHALPSSQALPFARAGIEHRPVEGLQVPASWHWSDAMQTTGFVPTQLPLRH